MFGKVQFEELESDILEKKCFQGENLGFKYWIEIVFEKREAAGQIVLSHTGCR